MGRAGRRRRQRLAGAVVAHPGAVAARTAGLAGLRPYRDLQRRRDTNPAGNAIYRLAGTAAARPAARLCRTGNRRRRNRPLLRADAALPGGICPERTRGD